uniref:MAX dimerization protein 1 n=1 Tax=Cyanistes caeruleus TaxID=156563 RepID=A0A8C0UUH4_CYACU
ATPHGRPLAAAGTNPPGFARAAVPRVPQGRGGSPAGVLGCQEPLQGPGAAGLKSSFVLPGHALGFPSRNILFASGQTIIVLRNKNPILKGRLASFCLAAVSSRFLEAHGGWEVGFSSCHPIFPQQRGGNAIWEADAAVCSRSRRAQLRLCLERLKGLVPLGAAAGRHTTLSLLTRARLHIQKLEDQERRALHQIEQLQREQRHLQRQLEKLGMERVRIDSIGSSLSSEQEMDVDVESTDDLPADLDWSSSSPSDSDERGSLQSLGSDEGYSSSGGTRARLAGSRKLPVGI